MKDRMALLLYLPYVINVLDLEFRFHSGRLYYQHISTDNCEPEMIKGGIVTHFGLYPSIIPPLIFRASIKIDQHHRLC